MNDRALKALAEEAVRRVIGQKFWQVIDERQKLHPSPSGIEPNVRKREKLPHHRQQFRRTVGPDGRLRLDVLLGDPYRDQRVVVTVKHVRRP